MDTAAEVAGVAEMFRSYGVTEDESRPIVDALRQRPDAWVDFMMRLELGLKQPDPTSALLSALTIAGADSVGGYIPLGPDIVLPKASTVLGASGAITLLAPLPLHVHDRMDHQCVTLVVTDDTKTAVETFRGEPDNPRPSELAARQNKT